MKFSKHVGREDMRIAFTFKEFLVVFLILAGLAYVGFRQFKANMKYHNTLNGGNNITNKK